MIAIPNLTHASTMTIEETHCWPACLRNVHLRLVREFIGNLNIRLVEELCSPARSFVNADGCKPRVNVGQLD